VKFAVIVILIAVGGILFFGAPFSQQPNLAMHYNSPEPILPMTFAHLDHVATPCIKCHHNYVDDTGMETCMGCHVSNMDVWPLLEEQFHDLCRDCHVEKLIAGEEAGPTRVCIDCHLEDAFP